MSIGPCLCGDPYCPSCGNPSLAAWESAMEELDKELEEKKLDEIEFRIFKSVGFAAVDAHREAMKEIKDRYADEP